ncbi:MAG: hypothetical protein KGJ79_06385 [Alphaproteobacteria bacterium]|nr:hypothetical protein [Alphaproteobacteria bacterium]MDE2110751.1 hypothetical protein [Alphaproteobacteria bacterium]MDE2494556.1 hypothetical protein [Alphaproteobacteria bacterium]
MKPWFCPKSAGIGISPCSWQGWLVVLLFAVGGGLIAILLPNDIGGFHGLKCSAFMAWTCVTAFVAVVTYSNTPDAEGFTLVEWFLRRPK